MSQTSSVCLVCLKSTSSEEESIKTEPPVKDDPDENLYKRFLLFAESHLSLDKHVVGTIFLPAINKYENEKGADDGGQHWNAFCFGCKSDIRVICQLYHELCDIRLRLNLRAEALAELMENSTEIVSTDNPDIGSLYSTLADQLRITEVGGDERHAREMRELLTRHCKGIASLRESEIKNESHPEVISGGDDDHFQNYEDDGDNELQMEMLLFPRDEEVPEDMELDPLQEDASNSINLDSVASGGASWPSSRLSSSSKQIAIATKKSESLLNSKKNWQNNPCHGSLTHEPPGFLADYIRTTCDSCGKEFEDQLMLQKHITELHEWKDTLPRFPCYHCFRSFSTEQGQTLHLKLYIHRGRNSSFNCEQHSQSYATPGELFHHFQLEHSNENVYSCSHCQWPFLDPYQMELHELVHARNVDKQSRYPCPVCNMGCGDTHILQSHFNKAHGKNIALHSCPECPCEFMSFYSFSLHLQKIHKAKTLGTSSAKILAKGKLQSQKKLSQPAHPTQLQKKAIRPVPGLISTTATFHANPRSKNVCNLCGKGFLTKYHVRRHLTQVHKKADPLCQYQCSICQRRFQSVDNLKSHFVKMHNPGTSSEAKHAPAPPAAGSSSKPSPRKIVIKSAPAPGPSRNQPTKVLSRRIVTKSIPDLQHNGNLKVPSLLNRMRRAPPPNSRLRQRQKNVISCVDCGQTFSTKSSMYDHRHLRHGTGLKQCPHCSKCFRRPFLLKNHLSSGQCTGQPAGEVMTEEEQAGGTFIEHLMDDESDPLLIPGMEEVEEILY